MFRLNNGVEIPEMGLGVYKMNAGKEMDDAVRYAYEQGYRLFDTAQMYKNESGLGEALEKNRIPRQDIFLISKVDNCNQGYGRTIESFGESLERLKTDYLDSFLVHWPGQNRERMLDTWKAMEKLYTDGKVRSIGVCNFEVCQLEYLLANCKVRPMIDQIEHTPFMHDEKLLGFCRENEIQVMAWGLYCGEIWTRRRLAGWLRDIIRRLLSYCCVGMSSRGLSRFQSRQIKNGYCRIFRYPILRLRKKI